jgi:hypothetical protein
MIEDLKSAGFGIIPRCVMLSEAKHPCQAASVKAAWDFFIEKP